MNLKWSLSLVLILWISSIQLIAQTNKSENNVNYKIGFSTYFAQIDDFGPAFEIFTDQKGNIYVSGNTMDKNYPVTQNAYQKELKGDADAFVAKFSPEGKLVYSTLIGGSKREHHTGLTVDKDGCAYLVGGTHSSDFPVTPNTYDTSFNGEKDWGGDVYLIKLNPSGSDIVFSTFIGGLAQETADVVHVDAKGNVLIGGCTGSSDFPVTNNAFDKQFRGFEAFLAKFSPDGQKLLFSTFIGGSENESLTSITTDAECNVYAAGYTRSNDWPLTQNALRKHGENIKDSEWWKGTDNYLVKLDEEGSNLIYSSYIGGKSRPVQSLRWFAPNKLLLAGNTNSQSFSITKKAFSKDNKGDRDGFISVFNSEEMKLEYSTLFGGNQYDFISSAFFLKNGQIVIGGETNSPDFPLTGNALDSVYPVTDSTYNSGFFGKRKFFISIIDIENNQFIYSSFLYGNKRLSIYPDEKGNIGFLIETDMTNFPVNGNAIQKTPTSFVVGQLSRK